MKNDRLPEDVKTRRGEPVRVLLDGKWREGYIEWGDETSRCVSIATEPGGARVVLYRGELEARMREDPGGARPFRDRRGIPWIANPAEEVSLSDAAITIKELARLLDEEASLIGGWSDALRKIARSLKRRAEREKEGAT